MAERPVYVSMDRAPYVKRVDISFDWNGGFAKVQKQKNITALHQNFKHLYPEHHVLEISSKSMQEHGENLSAFFLKKYVPSLDRKITVECIYQGSKVFGSKGPYSDLYMTTSKMAKKDERLKNSGKITGFRFENTDYPIIPANIFYNFIYMNALLENDMLTETLMDYDSFTDIEFNPNRSLNCQALAAAAYVGLCQAGKRNEIRNFDTFLRLFHIEDEKTAVYKTDHQPYQHTKEAEIMPDQADIHTGSKIGHKIYGDGTVKALKNTIITVDFPEVGQKDLGLKWVQSNCSIDNNV